MPEPNLRVASTRSRDDRSEHFLRRTPCFLDLNHITASLMVSDSLSVVHSLPITQEITMQQNVGTVDRVIRIVVGAALIGAAVGGVIGPWGWIGLVPLATGLFRFCPAYLPFGWSTCPAKIGTTAR